MNSLTMTAVRSVLQGVSQIFFLSNSWTGLLILIGIGIFDVRMATLVLFGSAVQAFGAWLLDAGEEAAQGLMGYNGALVGAVLGYELDNWKAGILLTIIGALSCIPVHRLFQKIFALPGLRNAQLPVSTAPFCTVAGLLFALVMPWISIDAPSSSEEPLAGTFLGIANEFAEVVLTDGWVTGLFIIVALFIGSWKVGLFGLLGSIVSALFLVILPLPMNMDDVSTGLYGYSAVLVSIALGTIFLNHLSLTTRILLALLGTVLTWLVQALLALTVIPVYTWPFLLSTWIVMLLVAKTRSKPASI